MNLHKFPTYICLKGILLISLIITFTTSCSKDDNEPIQLYYAVYNDKPSAVKDNQVGIIYPTSEKTQLMISGGDGDFMVSNSDETKLKVTTNDRLIELTPLSTGNIAVTIADKSGNSYILKVNIFYLENNFIIEKQEVVVIGDKLSGEQKKEIEQKAMLTLPVKVNGGYKLVHNIDQQTNKGPAFIYKENYGGEAVESVFEIKRIEVETGEIKQEYRAYVITIDGKEREFILNRYIASKGDMIVPMALNEVLTGQFKADYPDVEFVYTQQVLKR